MWVNVSVDSKVLVWIGVAVLIGILWVFGYKMYSQTRPDFKNIAYSTTSDTNKLDIYIPWSGATAPYPVVIWVHGGDFKSGSKSSPRSVDRLLSEGYAVVSVNYRLSDEATWPAQMIDMKSAIKFIKDNAATYKFNKDKIAVWWEDAGWYIATATLLNLGLDPELRIQAGVDWYGPVDFATMDSDTEKAKIGEKYVSKEWSPESRLLGVTIKDGDNTVKAASLLTLVAQYPSATPPILIMHGKLDDHIAYYQSERLRNAIQGRFGKDALQYSILDNGTHGWGDFEKTETEDTVMNFLKKHLK